MSRLLLNTIALEPNRWTAEKIPHFKLEALLEPIANAGFHFVEVWGNHFLLEDERTIKSYKSQSDDLGISLPIAGLYPQLHLSGDSRRNERDKFEKACNDCRILDSYLIKIFVGNQSSKRISGADYQRSVDFMREIAELAQQYDLIIAGETHDNTLFDAIVSCERFRNDVDQNNFKICFQPLDFTDTERAIADFDRLRDDVVHLHLQGRRNDEMSFLVDADIDYAAFLRALKERDFQGEMCIEFVKDCVVPTPADFDMKRVLKNAQKDRDFVLQEAGKFGLKILS